MFDRHQSSPSCALLLAALALVTLVAPQASSQTTNSTQPPQQTQEAPEETIRVSSNLIPVAASVVNARGGGAISDLKLEDFELHVDGKKREINGFTRAETPVRMAFLFDNSGSLNANRDFERKAAAAFFRRVMRPKDSAALYAVSTDSELIQPLTGNVNELERSIKKIGWPSGGTALLDAVSQTAKYLRPQSGRRVIVIISDGADTLSKMNFNDMLRDVQAADCQVYAVRTTGHVENANSRDLTGERRLLSLAEQTGGAMYSPKSPDELEAAFASIAADLAAQYVLNYYAAEEEGWQEEARFHPIELKIPARPEARVRFRKGYYTPGK